MRKDTKNNYYHFLQKEEVWIIQALVDIEKTQSPDQEEMIIINAMNRSLLINGQDPFIDTFEKFLELITKYEIEGMPASMTGYTDHRHYTGVGNGDFYRIYKDGKENVEKRTKARQDKRIKAFEKASLQYDQFDDILDNAALIREIQELKAEVARLRANQTVVIDPSVTQPTEHSFADIEQFARKQHSARIIEIRRRMKLTHDFDMACGIN